MNKITLTPKTHYVLGLYVKQHSTEKKITFPWVLSNVFKDKKYAKVDNIFFRYSALIKSDDYGSITVSIIDKRKQFSASSKVIEVELRSNLDTEISISNLEWSDLRSPCPYVLKIHLNLKGIRPETKIGELKIEPSFKYTNQLPDLQPISVVLSPSLPEHLRGKYKVRTERDENSIKYVRSQILKMPEIEPRSLLISEDRV